MILRLPKDILSGRSKRPDFYLCQADKTILGGLNVINASATFKFNSYSEVNCEVYKTYPHPITGEVVENPLYNKVEALRLLYVVDFGYFQIQESTIILEGNIEYKKVVAYSLEYSLCNRYLDNFMINLGVAGSIDGVTLLNDDKTHSLLHLILEKMPDWSVGTQVDLSLQNKKRSFDVNHQSIYDFMMNDMCDTFKCIFKFDTENNEIEVYDEESYSIDTNIRVSMDTIANSAEINYSADDIKTRLYVYGADDISIREANLGLEYITNINYYCTEDWLGKELYDAYMAYSKLTESKREKYSELILEWSKIYDEYSDCYNKVPHYEESNIPIVDKQSDLPQASSKYVYDIYKVKENGSYYICKAKVVNGNTTYQWELDVDGINSFYTLPTPSIEYVSGVYKVYNNDAYDGVLYYICQSYKKDNGETGYEWVLAENKYGINLLKEKELCYKDIQEAQVSAGFAEKTSDQYDRYLENYNKLMDIQSEIKKAESEAHTLKTQLEYYNTQMNEISKELALEKNFTPEQIKNLNPFIREDQLKDDHYLVTSIDDDKAAFEVKQELLKSADKELAKISQPQLSFSMSLANILDIPAFEPLLNNFETGNNIIVEIRPDYVVKTQILEINLNFDDMSDFNVTFGNLNSLSSQTDIHSALLSQAVSAGKSVAESSSYWDKGASNASSVINRIEAGLIDANTTIKSTTNQAISWDSHGFHLRKYADESKSTYEQEEIWMNNEKIVFTDDNWRTAKMAVGKFYDPELGDCYGIIAPNLVGKMIVGDNLVIQTENVDGQLCTFRVDENGARLYNSTFLMEKEVDGSTTHGQIIIDPAYGIIAGSDIYTTTSDGTIVPKFVNENNSIIRDDNSMPKNSNFFLDIDDGSAYFRGIVYADGGFFNGEVNADSGIIGGCTIVDGVLKVSSINIDGTISFGKLDQETQDKIAAPSNELKTFIDEQYAQDLQKVYDSMDKKAETWYQDSDPSTAWTEDGDKEIHLGDLWHYTGDTGKVNDVDRIKNSEWVWQQVNGSYQWVSIEVSDKVFDTIDGKAQIFTTTPTPPYFVGDLWVQGSTGDIKHCIKGKASNEKYDEKDWVKSSKYTDDSSLTTFISGEYADELETIHSQIDKKAETWYQSDDPSIAWTTDELKNKHVGDLWYDTDVNKSYIYGEDLGWHESDVPQIVYDKIDGKAIIYVTKPSSQNEGDLLIPNESFNRYSFVKNNIYRCTKSSSDFNYNDWVLVSYNDDVELHNFIKGRYLNYLRDIAHQEDLKAAIHPYGRYDKYRNLGREHHGDLFITEDGNKLIYEGGTAYSDATNEIPSYLFSYGNNYTEDNGVNNIFVALPDSQRYGDLFIPNVTVTIKFLEKKVYKCTKTSKTFNPIDWVEVDYTDDTKANEAYNLADTAQQTGEKLVNGLGFQETEITGNYIISPSITGGYLNIANTTSGSRVIIDPNNLTKNNYIFQVNNGSNVTMGVDKDGNSVFNGSITGGELLIENKKKGTLAHIDPDGLLTCKGANIEGTIYITDGELHLYNTKQGTSAHITSDGLLTCEGANISGHISASSIESPQIYGNDISVLDGYFNVKNSVYDSSNNFVRYDTVGHIGHAYGLDGTKGEDGKYRQTNGVALSYGDPTDLKEDDSYVIVTDSGVRMQSGWHSIYVTSSGCYQSVYDPESMKENPVRIGVCVFAE